MLRPKSAVFTFSVTEQVPLLQVPVDYALLHSGYWLLEFASGFFVCHVAMVHCKQPNRSPPLTYSQARNSASSVSVTSALQYWCDSGSLCCVLHRKCFMEKCLETGGALLTLLNDLHSLCPHQDVLGQLPPLQSYPAQWSHNWSS